MRYAQIRSMDISNGEGIGVSLFVQGCDKEPHCKNCFNQSTWDFTGGKEWTEETKKKFFDLISKPYISRISILGGEPLSFVNVIPIANLCSEIRNKFPNKKIWLYTGYTFGNLGRHQMRAVYCADILVDGSYIDELKDPRLAYRGSSNQRVIDLNETFRQNMRKVVLYCE